MNKFHIVPIGMAVLMAVHSEAVCQPCHISTEEQPTLFLNVDRTKLGMSDTLKIDVGVRNDTEESFYVMRRIAWGPAAGLTLELLTSDGHEMSPVVQDDTPLRFPRDKNDDPVVMVELVEGGFYGMRRTISVPHLVAKPGLYKIRVIYRNPFSCSKFGPHVQELNALWRESPAIVSNTVSLEIVPAPGAPATPKHM